MKKFVVTLLIIPLFLALFAAITFADETVTVSKESISKAELAYKNDEKIIKTYSIDEDFAV